MKKKKKIKEYIYQTKEHILKLKAILKILEKNL